MIRVVVTPEGEIAQRAAHTLAAHPGVAVSILGPEGSTEFPSVESAHGYDAVVGSRVALDAAEEAGIPAIVSADLDGRPGVAWASIRGLAVALSTQVAAPVRTAVAVPGEPSGNRTVVFPSPIDARTATVEYVDGHEVEVAGGEGEIAAAMALGADRHLTIIDYHPFLEGIALAAGVALLDHAGAVPVWERAGDYLRTATDMGLVMAERAA